MNNFIISALTIRFVWALSRLLGTILRLNVSNYVSFLSLFPYKEIEGGRETTGLLLRLIEAILLSLSCTVCILFYTLFKKEKRTTTAYIYICSLTIHPFNKKVFRYWCGGIHNLLLWVCCCKMVDATRPNEFLMRAFDDRQVLLEAAMANHSTEQIKDLIIGLKQRSETTFKCS